MPLSEFYRMAKSKLESSQEKTTTCSSDLSFLPDSELVELVWENGQILMQRQSDRARKNPVSTNFVSHTSKLEEDMMHAASSKSGKAGTVESVFNDIPVSIPTSEMDLDQNDDMTPWFYCPTDDTLQQDYFPEVLSDVTANVSDVTPHERNSCNKAGRDMKNVSVHNKMGLEQGISSKVSASRTAQLYPWSLQQGQTLMPSHSGVSDIFSTNSGNTNYVGSGDPIQDQGLAGGFPSMRSRKLDARLSTSTSDLLNFSQFSRPASMVRANLRNTAAVVASASTCAERLVNRDMDTATMIASGPVGVERLANRDMATAGGLNKPAESTLLDSSGSLLEEIGLDNQSNFVSSKMDSKPSIAESFEESCLVEQSDAIKKDESTNQILGMNTPQGGTDPEKTVELVVASSVCSGNSTDRASNDLTKSMKRTRWDNEESECQSEDIEEESAGMYKAVPSQGANGSKTGSKRSRSAEVHNLSERRRRDRINEKMRALQELIPNCNKVDKASMLDEAIEYLKTLQLQVQIMSMGAGLCMTPIMLPTGMQHIRTPHMPQYSPMNVGVGMGKGYGMGMLGMNGGPPGCPLIPISPIQGEQFPSASISGPCFFQGISGSNLQIFGHPGPGLLMPLPQAPFIPSSGHPPINSAMGLNDSAGVHANVLNPTPTLKPKDLIRNSNSQAMHDADGSGSRNQTGQFKVTNEGFNQPGLVQKNEPTPDGNDSTLLT